MATNTFSCGSITISGNAKSDIHQESTNNVASVTFTNTGTSASANAVLISAASGGITATPASNKDLTVSTSGTGKLSVTTAMAISATTNQMVLGTTNTTTLSAPAPASSITLTLPNTADTLVGRATTDTLTNKTWNGVIIGSTYGGTGVNNGSFTLTLGANSTINQNVSTSASPSFVLVNTDTINQSTTNATTVTVANTGTSTSASAVAISSTTGGITLTTAANKDVTLTTSGTGKTSVVALTATGATTVGGSVTAPTSTTQLNVTSTTQLSARIALTGQEFYQAANTSTEGMAIILGVNRAGGRQLWIGQTDLLTQNTTNPIIRIAAIPDASSGSYIDSVGTDGSTAHIMRINPSGGAVNIGGTTTVTGNIAATGTISNNQVADGDKFLLLGLTTYAKISHSGGYIFGCYSGTTTAPSVGQFAWYTSNGASAWASVMSLSNTGDLTVGNTGTNTISCGSISTVGTIGNVSTACTINTGGLKFANSTTSYSSYQLNYYEFGTSSAVAMTIANTGGTPTTMTMYFTRLGVNVTMMWQTTSWTNNSSGSQPAAASIVPLRFRPSTTIHVTYKMMNFGSDAISNFIIATTGTITFGCNSTGGNWSSGTSTFSIYGGTSHYTIL